MPILHQINQLRFASDAEILLLAGCALLLLAVFAMWGDRRRLKRRSIDQVGWVPWLPIFFVALFFALPMIALGIFALVGR